MDRGVREFSVTFGRSHKKTTLARPEPARISSSKAAQNKRSSHDSLGRCEQYANLASDTGVVITRVLEVGHVNSHIYRLQGSTNSTTFPFSWLRLWSRSISSPHSRPASHDRENNWVDLVNGAYLPVLQTHSHLLVRQCSWCSIWHSKQTNLIGFMSLDLDHYWP